MNLVDKLSEKLLEMESGCWEFIGGRNSQGYGYINIGYYQNKRAHILSYELEKGSVPTGLFVLHSCDNPACCRPDHLFLGTLQDNKDDEVSKERQARGSKQGNSKLVEADIHEIRKLLAEGNTPKFIGQLYGVTGEAIGLIKSGKNWGWLK